MATEAEIDAGTAFCGHLRRCGDCRMTVATFALMAHYYNRAPRKALTDELCSTGNALLDDFVRATDAARGPRA